MRDQRSLRIASLATAFVGFTFGGAGIASAHVKWFCAYNIAGQPEGLGNVLCQDFETLSLLGVVALLFGALVEKSFIGTALTRALDRVSFDFEVSSDVVMRAVMGFFFVALWTLGGVLLTPELATTSKVIPWMQLAFAASLVTRKTTIVAAVGIVFLYALAVTNYGIYHLADYPIFLGIAAYLAAISLGRNIFGVRPLDVLRWATAITLMWASIEKWAYPEWSYPLIAANPSMTLGFDASFFMRAAGAVEFSMAFALIWSPLVRRFGAIMLAATFLSAVVGFGKIDAIGHAPIIAVLALIIVDKTKAQVSFRRIATMPVQYGSALAAFLGLYYGMHLLAYGV